MARPEYERAGEFLRLALEEDPDSARIAAWNAYWHVFHVGQGWDTQDAGFEKARVLAERAIALDKDSAEALGIYGHICAFLKKDIDTALRYFDRALRLNPNLAHILALSAPTCCYAGKPEIALQRLQRYREIAPYDPYFPLFETMYPVAYVFLGDYKRAAEVGRRAVANNPKFSAGYKPLIAALGHLRLGDEAQVYRHALRELEPGFTVASHAAVYPFGRDSDRQRYLQGLRLAGVAEA